VYKYIPTCDQLAAASNSLKKLHKMCTCFRITLLHLFEILGDINKNKQMLPSICYLALAVALK
jgi:hypothetical protein